MRRQSFHILLIALAMLSASCRSGPRKIPEKKMIRIYADMLVADQWLLDNGSERKTADTTLFYEPVFRKYGYTTEDYQYSLHHYLKNAEKFDRMVDKVMETLEERKKCLENQLSSDQ